jgi:dTDP-4-dehydrorhamnose 3,5-epimerase
MLDSENKIQMWIPPGFAHGFSVLSDEAIFFYKCTGLYSKEHERSILFNDSELNIDWKVDKPLVSEKDLKATLFKDIKKDFIYKPE